MSRDDAQKAFDESCEENPRVKTTPMPRIHNTPEPRPPGTIPRRKRRRIKRPRRPKHLQIQRVPRPYMQTKLTPEQLLERQTKVFELRAQAKTWGEVAKIMGIGEQTARNDAMVIRRAKFTGLVDRHEEIVEEHKEHYDRLMSKWLPLAMHEGLLVGETKTNKTTGADYDVYLPTWEAARTATEQILKIMRQREQLEGFHDPKAPIKLDMNLSVDAMAVGEALRKAFTKPVIEATVVKSEITNGDH